MYPSARSVAMAERRRPATFRPGLELLEPRLALAVAALPEPAPAADLTALAVRRGAEVTWVYSSETKLAVAPGQPFEIVGALIDVSGELVSVGGVLQMEGYLRRGDSLGGLGEFDYSDGRFSPALAVDEAALDQVHAGLAGGWNVEPLHNRLSVALVHYVGDSAVTTDRFFVELQTMLPDFMIAGGVNEHRDFRVGQKIDVTVSVTNVGGGSFPAYVEGDVYHESDLTNPVWVGTFVSTDKTTGKLTNDNPLDRFPKHWRPNESGTYFVMLYADPEGEWLEGSEDNNVLVYTITVGAK